MMITFQLSDRRNCLSHPVCIPSFGDEMAWHPMGGQMAPELALSYTLQTAPLPYIFSYQQKIFYVHLRSQMSFPAGMESNRYFPTM
jgi:hypothetical protein